MAKLVLIETNSGSIQGIEKVSLLGDKYFNFQKIPYAEPPIGKLRFRVTN